MTADKVTLRLTAVVTYRVADAHKALSTADDVRQALYREAQLTLRAVVGGRELAPCLADKDDVAKELETMVRQWVAALGLEVISVGIRDVILPGDMKDLMNKGHGGQEDGRGQPDRAPRGDGGHAQPGQHGQSAAGMACTPTGPPTGRSPSR